MDFFQAQESARTRSQTLVLLFVMAVIAIIITIYAVVHFAVGPGLAGGVDWGLLLLVALGTTVIVMAGSAYRTLQLRDGGSKVAELLGGRRIRPDTTDEAERRLVNVVEEMAIASGTPVPAIYVLDREKGINAFAAGYTLDDAAVAVTHGALAHLNRDELQGVIAHEFSHVLNGDMRLNVRLIGLLFGILLLAVVGRSVIYGSHGRRNNRDGGGQAALIGIALIVVGYVGVFFGKIIQAAVSRQREYLADAAAVQFTRNPNGIAGALKKIGGAGSRLTSAHAQEASHLFFASGLRASVVGLLSTHPPLTDRIRRIEPAFTGEYPELESPGDEMTVSEPGGTLEGLTHGAFEGGADTVRSAALLDSIGTLQPEHVAYASRVMHALPPHVRKAAHDPDGASALLLALLLHDHGPAGAEQLRLLESSGGAALVSRVNDLSRAISPLGPAVRLPLLDLLLPALRGGGLSPDQTRSLRMTAQAMIAADGRMDVFELALLHVLGRQLGEDGRRQDLDARAEQTLTSVRAELEVVMSAIAWSGAEHGHSPSEAFAAGVARLAEPSVIVRLRPRDGITIDDVDRALGRLHDSPLEIRRRILEACVRIVAHDDLVDLDEAELLRAVAEALDCPIPPLIRPVMAV